MRTISASQVGRAGEFLVCFEFLSRGFDAILNPISISGVDIFVLVSVRKFLKVQVKSTAKPYVNGSYRFDFHHEYPAREIDAFALVALDIRAVVFWDGKLSFPRNYAIETFLEEAKGSTDRFLKSRNLW